MDRACSSSAASRQRITAEHPQVAKMRLTANPAAGSLCLGVWKPVGVRLSHLRRERGLHWSGSDGHDRSHSNHSGMTVDAVRNLMDNGHRRTLVTVRRSLEMSGNASPQEVSGVTSAEVFDQHDLVIFRLWPAVQQGPSVGSHG